MGQKIIPEHLGSVAVQGRGTESKVAAILSCETPVDDLNAPAATPVLFLITTPAKKGITSCLPNA